LSLSACLSVERERTNVVLGAEPFRGANSRWATQFRNILWNEKVHYSVNKSTPLVPVLGQIDPVQRLLFL
jgi:hypothetical protein